MYDENDRVYSYSMAFDPSIVIAGAQNVMVGELPDDAKLISKVTRRGCEIQQYRSASIRHVFPANGGPWDILVAVYSRPEAATPSFDGINVGEIIFGPTKAGSQPPDC